MTIKFYKNIQTVTLTECTLNTSTPDGSSSPATEEDLKKAGYVPIPEIHKCEEKLNKLYSEVSCLEAGIKCLQNERDFLFVRKLPSWGEGVTAIMNHIDFLLPEPALSKKYPKETLLPGQIYVRLIHGKIMPVQFHNDQVEPIITTNDVVFAARKLYIFQRNRKTLIENLYTDFRVPEIDAVHAVELALQIGAISESNNIIYVK